MARLKLFYDRKAGRVEVRGEKSDTPMVTMYPDEFADFLWQINSFVEGNTPPARRKPSLFAKAFHASMRTESWKWIGSVVKEKVWSILKK